VPLVFREHRVDGCVVLVSGLKRGKLKPMLEASRMPYIWINERDPENAAYPDDFFLGQRGAEILMEHGCHRTAYSGDPGSGENKHYSVQARRDGYQKAMQAAGRPARMIDYSTPDTLEASVQNILQADDRPDGVLCYGLREAQCFYLAARSLQLRIPDDLKILMIGEPGNNSIGTVEFALLRIPMFQTGIKAMELLETRMDGSSIDVPSVAVRHEQLDCGQTL
jgi:DNA-binding LacI/PurR family transcriptional regulator